MFNKAKFKAKVIERSLDMEDISKNLGINVATLYRKLNGNSDFTRSEIQKIKEALHLTLSEINEIFFAEELA